MQREITKLPGFPLFPFVFPLGVFLSLLGLSVWFSYLSWKDLEAIRRVEESRPLRS